MIEAARVVYSRLKNPCVGEEKKREYQEVIAPHEVFLEAIPSTVILMIILVISQGALCSLLDT